MEKKTAAIEHDAGDASLGRGFRHALADIGSRISGCAGLAGGVVNDLGIDVPARTMNAEAGLVARARLERGADTAATVVPAASSMTWA